MLINSPNISGSLKVSGNTVITGSLTTSIAALGTPATTFLTSNNGTIRSRTAAQTLSDIGGQVSGSYLTISSATGSYVPYTGATCCVNLGYNSLSASNININGNAPTVGSYLGFKHSTSVTTGVDGYTSMYTFGTNTIAYKSISGATTRDFSFSMACITSGVPGGRVYTLPDSNGTLALTSNLGAYIPLTGGAITGSLIVTGGITGDLTGSASTASYVEYTDVVNKPTLVSSSVQIKGYNIFATTGSNQFNGSQAITGSLTVTGQVVAQTINVQQVTSSIVYSCGSNIFGTSVSNTQQFTGSMLATGSLTLTGPMIGSSTACFGGNVCASSGTFSPTYSAGGTATVMTWQRTGGAVSANMIYNDANTSMNFGTNTAHSLNIKTNDTNRLTIDSGGVSCFACQVCAPRFRANVGGCGCIAFFSTNGNIVFDNASISAIGNMGSNASQFSVSSRGCLTFRVGENGDPSAAPLRFLMNTNGISCFACQICAPSFVGGTVSGTSGTFTGKLSVSQASTDFVGEFINTSATNPYGLRVVDASGAANNYPLFQVVNNAGTVEYFRVNSGTGLSTFSGVVCSACTVCAPTAIFSGCVGIGATSPSARLQVNTSSAGANALQLGVTSQEQYVFETGISGVTNGALVIKDSVTPFTYLTLRGGNVGIGTTCPTRALTVSGKAQLTSTSNTNELYLADACTSIIDNQWIGSIGNNITIGAGGFHRMNISSTGIACFACRVCSAGLTVTGDICFGIGTGAYDQVIMCYSGYNGGSPLVTIMPTTVPGAGSLTTQLLLKSNGLGGGSGCNHMGLHTQGATYLATCNGGVGIGTAAPNYKLEVNGNSCFAGNVAIGGSYCAFALNVHGVTYQIGGSTWVQNGYGYVNSGATTTGLFPLSDNTIQLRIANSAALTINASNYVGIGTTEPAKPLEIRTGGSNTTPSSIFNGAIVQAIVGGEPMIAFSSNISPSVGIPTASELTRAGIGFHYVSAALPSEFSIGIQCTNVCNSNVRIFNGVERMRITSTGIACFACQVCAPAAIFTGCVGIGCTSPGVSLVIGGTDAIRIPTGTTAQRPTGAAGMVRMNTTTGQPEWYNTATSTWASFNQDVNSYMVEYLVVGGGGGGGYDNGGGGGAGGFVMDCGLSVSSCTSYSVIVGAGGTATTGVSGFGGASCFNSVVALGGGGGGGQTNIGGDGGSGGGSMYFPIGAIRGGFGTIGQGFEGGCWTTLSSPWIGSGGGGASQRGFDGPFNGMGGAGKPSTLLGNTCYYAGGGNGSGDAPGCQTQPLGGGGIAGNPTGGNGDTNSGGGGGGGINGGNLGGNGGSGIVIIRYPGCQRGSGGTICSYCGTTIHVFTSSGTFVA